MTPNRYRRRPDLFSLLVVFVVLGLGVTLVYQVNLFYGGQVVPIAKRAPVKDSPAAIGG